MQKEAGKIFTTMAKKDYCKKYADYFGIRWDSALYDIHHIDHNRNNNSISNLILLPKKLHRRLHANERLLVSTIREEKMIDFIREVERANANALYYVGLERFDGFFQASNEMTQWAYYKRMNYTITEIPGIWNVK